MKQRCLLLSLLSLFLAESLSAQDSLCVIERIYHDESPMNIPARLFTESPVLKQYEKSYSLSNVGLDYESYRESQAIDVNQGKGHDYWRAGAESYIKHKNSTLWGHAHYRNGSIHDVKWNATADAALLYPYLTADSVGGDLDMEVYSLGGGYSDHRGKWSRGISVDYEAGLFYRCVDPRPKDVTGQIKLSAGVGYELNDHSMLAISVDAGKYKQTCDVMFVSEAGRTPVFHLTGGGNHYSRFAGASQTSHYSGKNYGLTFGLFPRSRIGLMAQARISRFEFEKILTDLNKLPLCNVWHNQIDFRLGYCRQNQALWADFQAWRRHGCENIFGDASAAVYPKIGALTMFADNHCSASLQAIFDAPVTAASALYVHLSGTYTYNSTIYASPQYEQLIQQLSASASVGYRSLVNGRWMLNANMGVMLAHPLWARLTLPDVGADDASQALAESERLKFSFLEKNRASLAPSLSLARAFNHSHALCLRLGYTHGIYRNSTYSNRWDLSLEFSF